MPNEPPQSGNYDWPNQFLERIHNRAHVIGALRRSRIDRICHEFVDPSLKPNILYPDCYRGTLF
jgi:hypothetical protein